MEEDFVCVGSSIKDHCLVCGSKRVTNGLTTEYGGVEFKCVCLDCGYSWMLV